MTWSKDDVEFLKTATEQGWTAKEIAVELDKTETSVSGKRKREGIYGNPGRNRKYTKEQLITIMQDAPIVTYNYFNSKGSGLPAATTYREYFGSWEKALKAAGINTNNFSMKEDRPTKVYLVDFGDFYKIGITQQSIKERLNAKYPPYEILLIMETTLHEARNIEAKWLDSVKEYSFIPSNFPSEGRGNTECFKI